jgi:hypothetical protein
MGSIIALLVGIVAVPTMIQQGAMRQLRRENISLRGETERLALLAKENEDLSNRLAQANIAQSPPSGAPLELLRLRGEVGVLRRQLQELEQLKSARSPGGPHDGAPAPPPSAETLRNRRIETQAEYVRIKTLAEELQEKASNPEGLARTILLSGVQDFLLSSLLERLALAEQKLVALQKDRDPEDPEVKDFGNQVADLKTKVETRSRGVLLGLEARAASLKESSDVLQRGLDNATGNFQ